MLIKLNVTILLVFSTKRPVLTIITLDSWPIYKTVINGTALTFNCVDKFTNLSR